MDFTNLDPQVVTLAKAIRTTESNNNYNAVGDKGDSHGAYQFNKGNFAHWATEEGLDPNDFSPVNQDKVAYAKMKSWKDQGYHAGEIAAMWNGSHLEKGRPVPNNPDYVTKVQKALGSSQPTDTYNPKPFSSGAVLLPDVGSLPSSQADNGQHGILADPSLKKFSDNPILNGLGQTGEQLGSDITGVGKSLASTANEVSKGAQGLMSKLVPGGAPIASLPDKIVKPTESQKPAFVGGLIGQALAPGTMGEGLEANLGKISSSPVGKLAKLAWKHKVSAGIMYELATNPKGVFNTIGKLLDLVNKP